MREEEESFRLHTGENTFSMTVDNILCHTSHWNRSPDLITTESMVEIPFRLIKLNL